MKISLTVLVLVLLLSILAGCAPGPNPSGKMASEHGEFAGFWLGLWQGFIAPFVFVASLFMGDLNVYEVHNNGSWYNFGYLFGLACFFRGGGNQTSRRRGKSNIGAGAKIDDQIPQPESIKRRAYRHHLQNCLQLGSQSLVCP